MEAQGWTPYGVGTALGDSEHHSVITDLHNKLLHPPQRNKVAKHPSPLLLLPFCIH